VQVLKVKQIKETLLDGAFPAVDIRYFNKMRKLNILIGLILFVALQGCGGGASEMLGINSQEYFGSITINQLNGRAGIIANTTSQNKANSESLKLCGESCVVVLEFGPGKCGALARSEAAPVFGWATGNDKPDTSIAALIQCQNKHALDCKIQLSECNS
jgi:hypothetical protein